MKGISLHQPWASAIAAGLKHFETRGWPIHYRGPIAIQAAKLDYMGVRKAMAWDPGPADRFETAAAAALGVTWVGKLPRGAVVAIATVVCCIRTEDLRPGRREATWGNYTSGRWAWGFVDIQPLAVPIPLRGSQGLFPIEASVEAALRATALPPLQPSPAVLVATDIHGTATCITPPLGILHDSKP